MSAPNAAASSGPAIVSTAAPRGSTPTRRVTTPTSSRPRPNVEDPKTKPDHDNANGRTGDTRTNA